MSYSDRERDGETDRQRDRERAGDVACLCVLACAHSTDRQVISRRHSRRLLTKPSPLFFACACVHVYSADFCVAASWAVHTYAALGRAGNSASCVFI